MQGDPKVLLRTSDQDWGQWLGSRLGSVVRIRILVRIIMDLFFKMLFPANKGVPVAMLGSESDLGHAS